MTMPPSYQGVSQHWLNVPCLTTVLSCVCDHSVVHWCGMVRYGTADWAPFELLALPWVSNGTMEFAPGTDQDYSSTNFILLGQ